MPSLKCPKCGEKIEKEWQKCPHCNTTLKIVCKKCGQELKEDWASCPNCGKKKVNYDKIKLQALVTIALFIIGIIITNVVYLDYPVTETYIDKEPYNVTETYTAKEPYVVKKLVTKTEKYLICGDATFDISNKSAYSNCLIKGDYTFGVGGWYHNVTGTPLLQEYNPSNFEFVTVGIPDGFVKYTMIGNPYTSIVRIPRDQCVCEVKEKTVTVNENVTEYRDVTKTRTVTKYKDVEKTRTITKKAKIWDIIFGNV